MTTCIIDACNNTPAGRDMCWKHYRRWLRHGDPHVNNAHGVKRDLSGRRFGELSVVRYESDLSRWLCICDCGRETLVPTASLTRGSSQRCGAGVHKMKAVVTYRAAHRRVVRERGKARNHSCVDCGKPAAHWSYDHSDPSELFEEDCGPYSLDTGHYVARCVSCHRFYDLLPRC